MKRGWHALEIRLPPEAAEVVAALLWEYPITGVEEREGCWVAFSRKPWPLGEIERELALRLARFGGSSGPREPPVVRSRYLEEEDWLETWKASWRPTPLGSRLIVLPAWWKEPIEGDRIPLWIEPGRAFGTGTHATTGLAWELLEEALESGEIPANMLDVGTGTGLLGMGVLAVAGSPRVWATEADRDALSSLVENLERNRVTRGFHPVRTPDLPFAAGSMGAAVANLTTREHEAVDSDLARVLAPRAWIVLSGLLEDQSPAVRERWTERGFAVEAIRRREGWVALLLLRPHSQTP